MVMGLRLRMIFVDFGEGGLLLGKFCWSDVGVVLGH